ncbi:MAG: LLM class flavin-dependent oxidoreductase [Gemmatimonadaceae bacterium]
MELGLYSFAEIGAGPGSAGQRSEQRLKDLLEEIELADQVGLDVFGVGEHHRPDYVVSTPAVVLAAAAARTTRIRLTSAVTVLSSDDPVRVFQEFSTVDLISHGRAEIMAGRGSFIESFPLFGYRLDDYDELFEEKLDLLLQLLRQDRVTWAGSHRAPLREQPVYPRPLQDPIPLWIAVGGTPQSVMRAGRLGLPLAIAIIGGAPARFGSFAELYRQEYQGAGHDASQLQLSINSHGLIADNSQDAAAIAFPPFFEVMSRIGRERGWPPPTRRQFDAECAPHGALLVGSPQQVIDKLLYEHSIFGFTRFLIQFSVGPVPHAAVMRSIELFGTQVAPAIRSALGAQTSGTRGQPPGTDATTRDIR